jgi:hypothetical protein
MGRTAKPASPVKKSAENKIRKITPYTILRESELYENVVRCIAGCYKNGLLGTAAMMECLLNAMKADMELWDMKSLMHQMRTSSTTVMMVLGDLNDPQWVRTRDTQVRSHRRIEAKHQGKKESELPDPIREAIDLPLPERRKREQQWADRLAVVKQELVGFKKEQAESRKRIAAERAANVAKERAAIARMRKQEKSRREKALERSRAKKAEKLKSR